MSEEHADSIEHGTTTHGSTEPGGSSGTQTAQRARARRCEIARDLLLLRRIGLSGRNHCVHR